MPYDWDNTLNPHSHQIEREQNNIFFVLKTSKTHPTHPTREEGESCERAGNERRKKIYTHSMYGISVGIELRQYIKYGVCFYIFDATITRDSEPQVSTGCKRRISILFP